MSANILPRLRNERKTKRTIPDSLRDLREDVQAPDRAIDLAACMVRHHDAVAADLESTACVRDALDALEHERAAV